MTKEELDNLVESLKTNSGLSVNEYALSDNREIDLKQYEGMLDASILDFYKELNDLKLYWYLDFDDTNIKILDEGRDIVSGEAHINFENFHSTFNGSSIPSIEDTSIAEILEKLNLKENFIVLDNCSPDRIIGFIRKDGVIKDNLFMIVAYDNNVYDLKVNAKTYCEVGFSAGFIFRWQEIFAYNTPFESFLKRIGYYLPKLLPENITSSFMTKFKERFGEVEYKTDDE